jgi:putative ABC transport system permease protein
LVRLIYSDVAVVCFLAFSAASMLALTGLPLFNHAIQKEIGYSVLFSWKPMGILILVYLLTVLLAGSYPALFLSKFSPVQTLGSNFQATKNRGLFRNSLVVVIFVVSIVLLGSTMVISKQTRFLQQIDLGFEKDQLVYVSLKGKLNAQISALKEEISRSSDVLSATVVSHLPTMIGNNGEGWNWEGKDPNFKPLVTSWETDEDLLKTFGARMVEGNYLDKNQEGIVINKTFANLIGWDSFVGKNLNDGDTQCRVLGVINDIRFNSISEEPKPMAIQMTKSWSSNYLILKVNTGQIGETLKNIQNICKAIEPDIPVTYGFMNDQYAKMLASETNLNKLVGIFSVFATIVLCLGLLGVVMFMAEQKTKEIGVRKCMGEEVSSIISRFIKPFLLAGLIACFIAIPLTWYIMDRWLQSYALRIQLNIWDFIATGFIAIAIALLTVSWQSWRAATRNPVEALRYE